MATEIQWDEPQEWQASSPDKVGAHPRWEAHVSQRAHEAAGTDWEWSLQYRSAGGALEVRGCESSVERAKSSTGDALQRLDVAFRPPTADAWPDAVRHLLEAEEKSLSLSHNADANTVAAIRDEHRAAVERARRLLQ